jgi:hypothetical protein
MQYIHEAMKYADKSPAKNHKHGAVCVIGGKIISGGWNFPEDPHWFKVQEEQVQV